MPSYLPNSPNIGLLFASAAVLLLAGVVGQLFRRHKAATCKGDYRWFPMAVGSVLAAGLSALAYAHLLETRDWANMITIFAGILLVAITSAAAFQLMRKGGGRFTGRLVYGILALTAALLALAGTAKGQALYSNAGGFALNSTWLQLYNIAVTVAEIMMWVLSAAIVFALIWMAVAKIGNKRRASATSTGKAAAAAPTSPTTPPPLPAASAAATSPTGRRRRRRTPGGSSGTP